MSDVEQDDDFELFLEAVREANDPEGHDIFALKAEAEAYQARLQKLAKEHRKVLASQRKQAAIIEQLNKERIKSKKQLIETSYGRKSAEAALTMAGGDVTTLKNELKGKNELLLALEKERRSLEVELSKQERRPRDVERRNSSSRTINPSQSSPVRINVVAVRPRLRSVSADRLKDKRGHYGKQLLLKSGLPLAYAASKEDLSSIGSPVGDGHRSELEKVVLLQKLLLAKSRHVIERDVRIEELEKRLDNQVQAVGRLKRAKQFADELTQTRHKLNLRTSQLTALKDECSKYKTEVTGLRAEITRLRNRLSEFYNERIYFG